MLTVIVACDLNNAIGKSNRIPWDCPEDLRFFQRETIGGAVIMGRNTWLSLPVRPLRSRLNLVVSSDKNIAENVFSDPTQAYNHALSSHRRVYAIGGSEIYRSLFPFAHRLLLTRVELLISEADAYFPDFDESEWSLLGRMTVREGMPRCVLEEYVRR